MMSPSVDYIYQKDTTFELSFQFAMILSLTCPELIKCLLPILERISFLPPASAINHKRQWIPVILYIHCLFWLILIWWIFWVSILNQICRSWSNALWLLLAQPSYINKGRKTHFAYMAVFMKVQVAVISASGFTAHFYSYCCRFTLIPVSLSGILQSFLPHP